jgi:hypothetical protein
MAMSLPRFTAPLPPRTPAVWRSQSAIDSLVIANRYRPAPGVCFDDAAIVPSVHGPPPALVMPSASSSVCTGSLTLKRLDGSKRKPGLQVPQVVRGFDRKGWRRKSDLFQALNL